MRFTRCTKGLAQLVGMTKLEGPQTITEQFERYLGEYDNSITFLSTTNIRTCTARMGLCGEAKVDRRFDAALPILLRKRPEVLR